MAKLNFVKKAQKDIWENGKPIKRKSPKTGKMIDTVDRSLPENKDDELLVKKGESYYWWQFRFGGKNISKDRPRRSQLTQSNFYSTLWDIEDRMGEINCQTTEDLETEIEDIKSELENLRDECQGSLDNMPDSLQQAPTGELLQSRVDGLDEMINELENIDIDTSFDESESDESLEEYLQGKIEEIQEVNYNGE